MTNPYAPPRAIVEDITEPAEDTVPAERLTRLGAAILDTIIVGVAVYAPAMLVLFGSEPEGSFGADDDLNPLVTTGLIGMIVGFGIWLFFTLRYLSQNSQSIAKKFLDIKVVRSDGSRASIGRIFWLRNVVLAVLGLLPMFGWMVGIVDALFIFTESRQCLHDRIADTIVIKA